jgi:PAS domain S-box-containing protein
MPDSDELLALLMENVTEYALIILDPDGIVALWNAGAQRLLGYEDREIIGVSFAAFFTPEDIAAGRPEQELQTARAHGRAEDENWMVRKDGSRLWASGMTMPLWDEQQRLRGFTKILRDSTERKQLEAERDDLLRREQASLMQAQAALRARDALLSMASHELKNSLAVLVGNAQALQRRLAREKTLSARDEQALDLITDQARRMSMLIEAVLDSSRLEAGQVQIEQVPLGLTALTERVVEAVQPTLEQHTLAFISQGETLMIAGDELRLTQVLHNLIGNAVKYSPHGGTITVRAYRRDQMACVSVTDEGIGIPAAALPHLFERFYRAENVSGTPMGGLGIGLYVVKEVVELHGGTVAVESTEGKGSTFMLCLPLIVEIDEEGEPESQ